MPVKIKGARGVRLDPKHDARTRAKIQTSQIINRLQEFIFAKLDPEKGAKSSGMMTSTQVTAALGLLKKTLPDLQSIELSGVIEDGREKRTEEYTDEELQAIIESGKRDDAAPSSKRKLRRLH